MIVNITEKMMKPIALLIRAIKDDLNSNEPAAKKKGRPSKYPLISDLHFFDSPRSQGKLITNLHNNGITTAKQLSTYTKVELIAIRGVANKSVQRIEEVLMELGLKLKK